MPESTVLLVGIGVVLLYLICLGLGLAQYILEALSLYRIGRNCGMANPWLAWLPVGDAWVIGSIADRADSERGITRKWRVALLVLTLIVFLALFLYIAVILITVFLVSFGDLSMYDEGVLVALFGVFYVVVFLLVIPTMLLTALQSICLYKIFESIVPEKALKYFIISLIVPLACGICLLKCSRLCPEKGPDFGA